MYNSVRSEIPKFNKNGNLPPGIFEVPIELIISRFSGPSLKRVELSKLLKDFYEEIKIYCVSFFVNGSFTTSKLLPGDIDILIILKEELFMNSFEKGIIMGILQKWRMKNPDIFAFPQMQEQGLILNYFYTFTHDKYSKKEKGIVSIRISND